LIFKGHSSGSKREDGLNPEGGYSMVFEMGLRKWAILRIGSLSPAGESI